MQDSRNAAVTHGRINMTDRVQSDKKLTIHE
jgi:hypothetical protein